MWSARSEELADARELRFAVALDSRPATFAEVIRAWEGDAGFRSQFNAWLSNSTNSNGRFTVRAVTGGRPHRSRHAP